MKQLIADSRYLLKQFENYKNITNKKFLSIKQIELIDKALPEAVTKDFKQLTHLKKQFERYI